MGPVKVPTEAIEVDYMAQMSRPGADLAICFGVFIGGLGVIGATETVIPEIKTRDFVARISAPTRPPKNAFGYCRRQDFAVVPEHVDGSFPPVDPGGTLLRVLRQEIGLKAARPMDTKHRRLYPRRFREILQT